MEEEQGFNLSHHSILFIRIHLSGLHAYFNAYTHVLSLIYILYIVPIKFNCLILLPNSIIFSILSSIPVKCFAIVD